MTDLSEQNRLQYEAELESKRQHLFNEKVRAEFERWYTKKYNRPLYLTQNNLDEIWDAWQSSKSYYTYVWEQKGKVYAKMLVELKAIGHHIQVDTGHYNRIQRLIEEVENTAGYADKMLNTELDELHRRGT